MTSFTNAYIFPFSNAVVLAVMVSTWDLSQTSSANTYFAVSPIWSKISGSLESQIVVNEVWALSLMMSFICFNVRCFSTAVSSSSLIVIAGMLISSILLAAEGEELDEEAKKEKSKLKATQDILTYKNIRKFEVQDIAHIPKTTALTENQAINIY